MHAKVIVFPINVGGWKVVLIVVACEHQLALQVVGVLPGQVPTVLGVAT